MVSRIQFISIIIIYYRIGLDLVLDFQIKIMIIKVQIKIVFIFQLIILAFNEWI